MIVATTETTAHSLGLVRFVLPKCSTPRSVGLGLVRSPKNAPCRGRLGLVRSCQNPPGRGRLGLVRSPCRHRLSNLDDIKLSSKYRTHRPLPNGKSRRRES